jgi:hypothetical protein
MKKCPVCDREYDDNMRFCQTDGTALVEKSEPVDPYKTVVGSREDILSAIPPEPAKTEPPVPEPSVPAPLENEILEIPPANDPNKTQFVSEAELRAEMEKHSAAENVIDIPPATEDAPSDIPITGDAASSPPPSPFSTPSAASDDEPGPANFPTSPPIPSPFSPKPKAPEPAAAEEPLVNPFEKAQAAPMAQAGVNPPASPESNMQNPQNFGQQFTPPAAGQNKTLAIISLISGIAGLTICCGWFLPSLLGLVLGFMARGKATSNPGEYGGAGLAMGGIITGAIGIIGGIIAWIVYVFYFAAIMASMPR